MVKTLKTEIVIDEDVLISALRNDDYEYVTDTHTMIAYYQQDNPSYPQDARNAVYSAISVKVDNSPNGTLKGYLEYKWKVKGTDGNFVDLPLTDYFPHAIGEYQMVATLAAQADVCTDAEAVVLNMEVVKAVVNVAADTTGVTPGMTVEEVLAKYANVQLRLNGASSAVDQTVYAAKVDMKVIDAYDAEETALGGTVTLQRNQDYRLIFAVTLRDDAKDNYTVGKTDFLIHFDGPVATQIEVTYTNPGKEIAKVYDGAPVAVDTLVKPEYTARVIYGRRFNDTLGVWEENELKDVEISTVWCDADKAPYASDFVPVDAGVYYYKLFFTDETDTYQKSEAYIKVEIRMATIVIEAKMDSANVYAGQKASDILKKVFYNVYKIAADGTKATSPENIDTYYWGVAYNQDNDKEATKPSTSGNAYTQSYEPLFAIQRAIKQADPADAKKFVTVGWEKLDSNTVLEMTHEEAVVGSDGRQETIILPNEYRVVFYGKKGIYQSSGYTKQEIDINSAQQNYRVDWTDAAIDKYSLAVPLVLADAKDVTIDVSALLDSENGKNFDNPIVKTYNGEDLYKTKDLYKKAVAKSGTTTIASNEDSRLTYTWQQARIVSKEEVDVNGVKTIKYYVDESNWYVPSNYNDVETQSSPRSAGVYRLEIKFSDPTNEYREATQYVYYTIKPQDIIAVLQGAENEDGTTAVPVIYADGRNTDASIVSMIQNTDPENKETYVDLAFYYAIVTEDAAGNVTVKEDLENPLTRDDVPDCFFDPVCKAYYFYVEKLVTEGKDAGKWIEYNGVLKQDETYRLNIHNLNNNYYDSYNGYWYNCGFSSNYNFGKKRNKHNYVETDDQNNDIVYYENKALEVATKNTQGIELQIEVDTDRILNNIKIYDGKPFDLTNLKSLVKVYTKKEGTDVTKDVVDKGLLNYTFQLATPILDVHYDNSPDQYIRSMSAEEAVHANTYTMVISLAANDTYQGVTYTVGKTYQILRKEIVIKPILVDSINAGKVKHDGETEQQGWQKILSGYNNNTHFAVDTTQIVEGDEDLVSAIDTVKYNVKDTEGTIYYGYETSSSATLNNSNLRSSKTYYVEAVAGSPVTWKNQPGASVIFKYDDESRKDYHRVSYYDLDYSFKHESVSFTPARVAGTVTSYGDDNQKTVLKDVPVAKDGSFVHTITALEGVPYFYGNEFNLYDKDDDKYISWTEGNYILLAVHRPEEFDEDGTGFAIDYAGSDYVYANSIERAGGYFVDLDKDGDKDCSNSYITLAFKVSDFDAAENPSFDIMWEKDYVETYIVDLKQMQSYLEADLRKAVSPKSLSFNGVSKKMAVGETQQLDVKMSKAQMSDIICLGYASSDENVLKVSETGLVTAISTLGKKNATATIEVFPCRIVNGVKVRITDKGTKTAKVKITVSNVAAPKIGKVTTYDTYAYLTYTLPANGYRREIYVMQDKKKAQDFEAAIANVKNGDYSAFVSVALDQYENVIDTKKNTIQAGITGLTPNTTYTVYVRNVSGIRVLEDGTQIATSAAGNVKSFKTPLSQIKKLRVYFDADSPKQTVSKEWRHGKYMNVAYLKDKSATVSVDAMLYEYFSKGYSDKIETTTNTSIDYIWRPMPMAKELKKYYYAPKISYYVCEDAPVFTESDANKEWGAGKWVYVDRPYEADTNSTLTSGYYSKTSTIAKVDKKGKVTFKGKGYVYVIAQDSVTGLSAVVRLFIDASPTSMTAKKAKFVPGQAIDLSSLLEYKEGKTKIVGYAKEHYNIYTLTNEYFVNLSTPEATAEDYRINRIRRNGFVSIDDAYDYSIQAVKAGGKRNVEITDATVAANGGKTAVAKLTTAVVQPVKKLKASRVVDDGFVFTFQYPEETFQFVLELRDAKGNVIRNEIKTLTGYRDTKSKKANYIFTYGYADNDTTVNGLYNWYDADRNTYPFQHGYYGFNETTQLGTYSYSEVELTKNSNYNLTVTAICEGQSSKVAKKKVKTTNIPLSYRDVTNLRNWDGSLKNGGESIYVRDLATGEKGYSSSLSSNPILRTGNTYTLYMSSWSASKGSYDSFNNVDVAGMRVTDTLKWKSSNTKVATVKAKSATTASLKAVKQGTTVIEAKSKITKKVVARWTVTVGAAGDAGSYYGDNEPYRNEDGTVMLPLEGEALQLTVDNGIETRLKKGEAKWVEFTAPADGEYLFTAYGANRNYIIGHDKDQNSLDDGYYHELEKNAKVYIYLDNTYGSACWAHVRVDGTLYKKIYIDSQNNVKDDDHVIFTAPETNYYTFKVIDNTEKDDNAKVKQTYEVGMELGNSVNWIVGDDNYGTLSGAILPSREYTIEITKREMTENGVLEVDKAKELSLTATQTDPTQNNTNPNSPVASDSEKKWYSFTADQTNTFKFSFTDVLDGRLYVDYYKTLDQTSGSRIINVTGDMTVKVAEIDPPTTPNKGEDSYEIDMNKGETIYFRLTCVPGDPACAEVAEDKANNVAHKDAHKGTPVTAKVTVTRHKFAVDLKEGEKADVDIAKDIPVWYSFTADETGYYTISTTGATKYISAEVYSDLKGNGYAGSLAHHAKADKTDNIYAVDYYLTKDSTIFLKLDSTEATATDSVTARLLVEKRKPKEVLEVGKAADVALDQGDVLWYEFDAKEFNMYTFSTTGAQNPENKDDRSAGVINVEFYKDITKNTTESVSVSHTDGYNFTVSNYEMNSRGKIYLRLTLNPGFAPAKPVQAKLMVTKRGEFSEMPIATSKTVSVKKGVDQWFKIIADERNFYEVCLTGGKDSVGPVRVELYDSLDGSVVDWWSVDKDEYQEFDESDMGYELERGTVRYLHMTTDAATSNDVSADVIVYVRKRKVETTALDTKDAGTVVELKQNDVKWYQFTSTADNIYNIVGEGIENGIMDAEVYTDLRNSGNVRTGQADSDIPNSKIEMNNIVIKSGKTVYVKLIASAATDTTKPVKVTIKVKGRPVGDKNIDAAGVGITLKQAGDEIWYPFVADEKNCYTFYAENVEGGNVEATYYTSLDASLTASNRVSLGTSGADKLLNGSMKEIYIPNDGKTVYVRVRATSVTAAGGVTLTLKAKKRALSERKLALGDTGVEVKLKKGEEAWYAFTSDMDNMYTFYADDVEKGDLEIYYYSGCAGSGDHNHTTLGVTHFDGSYGFNQQVDHDRYAYSSWNTPVDGKGSVRIANCSIMKGQTVYVRVKGIAPTDGQAATVVSMTLKVKRREVESTALEPGDTGVSVELDSKTEKWFKFVAPEDNLYTIYSNNIKDGSLTAGYTRHLYDGYAASTSYANTKFEFPYIPMEKGEVVYIGLTNASPDTGKTKVTATLKVKKVDPKKLVVGSVDSSELTGDDQWYVFEPDETDSYVFNVEVSDDKPDTIKLYYRTGLMGGEDEFDDVDNRNKFETNHLYLKAHEKYYLRAVCGTANDTTNKVTVKMSVKKRADGENAIVLANGEKKSLAMSSMNADYKWYAIKATENGYYNIKVSTEVVETGTSPKSREINIYSKDDSQDEIVSITGWSDTEIVEKEENGDPKKERKVYTHSRFIAKGDTLYIRVKTNMATVTDAKDAIETKLDIERSYEVVRTVTQGPNGVEKCAFTAPKNGTYYFFTIGKADTYGEVYRNGVQLTFNNYGNRNTSNREDCYMSCSLEKGQTVEFSVKEYHNNAFTTELHIADVGYYYYMVD